MTWGPWQIAILVFVVLLFFGSKKLPELAHSLGKSLGEFKKGKEEGDKELKKPAEPAEPKQIADSKSVVSGAVA